jgi:flagellar biosynthesis protein FlhG
MAPQDQAASLRALLAPPRLFSVSINGGGTSAGSTSITLNLAHAFAVQGRQVLVLDEYGHHHNLASRLGLTPRWTLENILTRKLPLESLLLTGPDGLRVLPLDARPQVLAELSPPQQKRLTDEFVSLTQQVDTLFVDARPASPTHLPSLALAAEHTLVIITSHADSLTAAYATIKRMSQEFARNEFWILVNRVESLASARRLFNRLQGVSRRYLQVSLRFMGFVPDDMKLYRATHLFKPVLNAFPDAESAVACIQLSQVMQQWPHAATFPATAASFMQRLLESSKMSRFNLS